MKTYRKLFDDVNLSNSILQVSLPPVTSIKNNFCTIVKTNLLKYYTPPICAKQAFTFSNRNKKDLFSRVIQISVKVYAQHKNTPMCMDAQ